jgi:hypothetical protein
LIIGGDAGVWPIAGAAAPNTPPTNAALPFRNSLRPDRFEPMGLSPSNEPCRKSVRRSIRPARSDSQNNRQTICAGDNLYSCSVLALDPDTGKLKWFFQFTPHDLHDWDSTQIPILLDTQFRGENKNRSRGPTATASIICWIAPREHS